MKRKRRPRHGPAASGARLVPSNHRFARPQLLERPLGGVDLGPGLGGGGDVRVHPPVPRREVVQHRVAPLVQNAKVGEIARDRIDKYLKAVGQSEGLEGIGQDLSKLNNYLELPFIAVVGTQAGSNGYPDSNKIKAFKQR